MTSLNFNTQGVGSYPHKPPHSCMSVGASLHYCSEVCYILSVLAERKLLSTLELIAGTLKNRLLWRFFSVFLHYAIKMLVTLTYLSDYKFYR